MIPFQIISIKSILNFSTAYCALLLIYSAPNFAQDLVLDENYGNNGVYFTEASKISGKIVLDGNKFLIIEDKVISRLNFDGTTDESFGISGKRDLFFEGLSFKITNYTVKNSSVYLCGWLEKSEYGASRDVLIVKIDPNGNYDSSFGTNGYTTVDFGKNELLESIYITEKNEVIATGTITPREYTNSNENLFIIKLLNNGNLDYSYYSKGYLETSLTDKQSTIGQNILKSFNDGYYLISKGNPGENQNKWAITKLNSDATIDPNYATNGSFFSNIESVNDNIISVKLNTNDEIDIISQYSTPPIESGILFRKINLKTLETTTSFKFSESIGTINDLIIEDNKVTILNFLDKRCNDNGNIFYCRRDFYIEKYTDLGELDFNFNTTGSYNITQYSFLDEYQPKIGIFNIEKTLNGYTIYGVAGKNDGYYKIWSIKLKEAPLSINNFLKTNQSFVSPNPANNIITVSLKDNSAIEKVSIYNINGSLLLEKSNSNIVDISELKKGLYFVKIEAEKTIHTQKVIKE